MLGSKAVMIILTIYLWNRAHFVEFSFTPLALYKTGGLSVGNMIFLNLAYMYNNLLK